MTSKLLRTLTVLAAVFVVIMFAVRWNEESSQKMRPVDATGQGSVQMQREAPGDLTGDWTTRPDARVKFIAEIRAGTILVHMISKGDTIAYYYGTFTTSNNKNEFVSTKIDDGKIVWCVDCPTKTFLYQNGNIHFDFGIAGITSAIELIRE